MRGRFRNLPLFWKLLVPFLALMVLVGAFGVFVLSRDLASRAEAELTQDLAQRSLEARSALRDRELYLVESGNFAANIQGMSAAIGRKDDDRIGRLLQSVIALKADLVLAATTDDTGTGRVEFVRSQAGAHPSFGRGTRWSRYAFVRRALNDTGGNKHSGFIREEDRTALAVATPICSGQRRCASVGVAIVGVGADTLAAAADGQAGASERAASGIVALFDGSNRLLGSSGVSEGTFPPPPRNAPGLRQTTRVGGAEVAMLYSPLEVGKRRVGTLVVGIPTAKAFSPLSGAAFRLALIFFVAMVGVVAIGARLSRSILGQLKPLIETNRALGRGDLSARVPVASNDELGEVARGVNQMAEQLEASYETLELRVAQRTEEVQRLLEERTEFFASLSHELRTPLAVILREAQLMKDPTYPKRGSWASDTGRMIGASAEQLLALVNEVLDLARAEAGRIDVDLQPVNIADLMHDLKPMIHGLARGSGLDVDVRIPRDLPQVEADHSRLREVIINLVDNAVKYTPEGGSVELSASAHNGTVDFIVSDTGIGIPEDNADRIFDPFYTVKGSRPLRGQSSSGLGLALSKRLVEAQGGSIGFVSEPNKGSVFTISLRPVKPKDASPAQPKGRP